MKNPKTTIIGVIALVISGLTLFNVVPPATGNDLGQFAQEIITAIFGIVALFSKDDTI